MRGIASPRRTAPSAFMANGGSATKRPRLFAIITASRRWMARATGCSAMDPLSRAAAGGCTAWVKHELRRFAGDDAFLVYARRLLRRRAVFDGGRPWHQGA